MIKFERITKRWMLKSFVFIMVALVFVETALIFINKNSSYAQVQQIVKAKATVIQNIVDTYAADSDINFVEQTRALVEGFDDNARMELIAINRDKQALVSSSGFAPTNVNTPDLRKALKSSDRMGDFLGKLDSGEKIYSVSIAMSNQTGDIIALKLMVSLSRVDRQIFITSLFYIAIGLIVGIIILLTNLSFLHSIVKPIVETIRTARKIASGDFEVRIENNYKDEVSDLCDIINYMADELNQSETLKNEFISSVSHELRTPLTSIRGWGETLLDEQNSDSKIREKGLKIIIDETERLSSIVEELLDFSKIQSGHFSIKKEKMDILAELEEAILIFSERAKRENKKIEYNEPQMLSYIYGDKNRIRQVFVNILDNAMKYSESGSTITVNAREEYSVIYISIKDEGCGISSEDLPKIKKKFYKANLTKRGSGIGLAVVDEIITMLDGNVEIKSRAGEGTEVTISLPAIVKE